MNTQTIKEALQNDQRKITALLSSATIINNMGEIGYDGAQVFLTFRVALLKCIEIIPKDLEDAKEMQDILIKDLRKEIQLLEDRILQERIDEGFNRV